MSLYEITIEAKSKDDLLSALESLEDINVANETFKETLLHKAAQNDWAEGLTILIEKGAEIIAVNSFNQTPLHYAVASKSLACVRVLVKNGNLALFNRKDTRGLTALHEAAAVGLSDIVEELVLAGACLDSVSNSGKTPLHYAVASRDEKCVFCLLKGGADILSKDFLGNSPLALMLYSHQDVFQSVLNKCFTDSDEIKILNETRINVEFLPLINKNNYSELDVLREILLFGSIKLISHPLCEIFLLIQWLSLKTYFIFEMFAYFIFTILSTILILDKFVWMRTLEHSPQFVEGVVYVIFLCVVIFGAALMLLRQFFIIIHGLKIRFISVWYILNFIVPIMVLTVILGRYMLWQDHLAAITVLLAWVQGMLHVGRFPKWGIYIAMFTSVARNLLKTFLIFSCVFIAFALSFNIIFFSKHFPVSENDTNSEATSLSTEDIVFSNIYLTLIKTLTMMTGELNFNKDLIEVLNHLPGTSHSIFVSFVFLMTILLSNLLVALAVNDVQGLKGKARIEKLFKQAELAELMATTCEAAAKILHFLKFRKRGTQIRLPSCIGEDTVVNISINDHYKCGNLIVTRQNNKPEIISLPSPLLDDVKVCLKSASDDRKVLTNADWTNLEKVLCSLSTSVQSLCDKCSNIEQKMLNIENQLENSKME